MVETTAKPDVDEKKKPAVVEKPEETSDDSPEDSAAAVSNQQNDAKALAVARQRDGKVPDAFGSVEITENAPASPEGAPTLDKATLEKHAKALNDAIHNRWLGIFKDVDNDKIARILEPLSPADRKALEQVYREKFGKPDSGPNFLRDELKGKLGELDYRRTEAILNRQPGRTNDAGALQVALTTMKDDPARGNKELRSVLKTLTAEQLNVMDQDFRAQYGKGYLDAIREARGLSPENKAALDYLTKGSDQRTPADVVKAANIALQHGNKEMLAQVIAGDSPAATAARQQLQQDSKFMTDFNNRHKNDQVMKDFLREGRVSLSTIAIDNTDNIWFLDNKDNVRLAAKNASEKEQRDFSMGRELALGKKEPKTQEERDALAFYKKIHSAFEKSGNGRDVQVWEDQLMRRGSLATDMIESYDTGFLGMGAGTNKQDMFSKIENMSEADWKRLKDPASSANFKRDLEMALDSFASEGEKRRAMKLIEDKMAAGTFEESKAVKRTVLETIQDNTGSKFLGMGTSYDGKSITEQIASMPPREREKYRNDPEYRKQLDEFVDKNLGDTEKMLARRILDRAAQNREPSEQEKKVDAVLLNAVKGEKREKSIRDIEALMQDKTVRDRLNKPDAEMTAEDRALKRVIENQIVAATYGLSKVPPDLDHANPSARHPIVDRMRKPMFEEGRVPVDLKMRMGFPRKDIIESASQPNVPEQERQAVLRRLSADERQIVENGVKQNGQLTLADKVRGMVAGDGTKYSDFKQDLEKLSPAEMQKLKDEYAKKYGTAFNDDFLKRVDEKDQIAYKTLITPQKTDARQVFYDMTKQLLDNGGGMTTDGTALTLDRATKMYEENLEKYGGNIPPEMQKQLTEYFSESLKQYKDSKEKLAEVVVDATITVVAIAATIASGGVLGPAAIAAIAASSAAFRVAAKKAIQGGSFELTAGNVLKEGAIGALTGTLAALGPETFALIGKTGTIAAASTGRVLAREGVETLIEQGVLKGGRETAERALSDKIAKVLTNNLVNGEKIAARQVDDIARSLMDDAAQAALKSTNPAVREAAELQMQTLSKAIRHELGDAVTDKVRLSGREWASDMYYNTILKSARNNAVIGGVSNVAAEPVYSFLKGEGLNYDKLIQGGLTGLAFGAIAPVGFKGAFKAVEVGATGVGKLTTFTGDIVTRLSRTADGKIDFDPVNNPHISGFEVPGRNHGDPPTVINADSIPPGQRAVVPEGAVPVLRTNADGQLVDKQGRLVNADGSLKAAAPNDGALVRAANADGARLDASDTAHLEPKNIDIKRLDVQADIGPEGALRSVVLNDGRRVEPEFEVVNGQRVLKEVIFTKPDAADPTKTVPDGAIYKEDGQWMQWKRGEQPQPLRDVDTVTVDAEGNVFTKYRPESSIDTVVRQADGSTITSMRDGSSIRHLNDGKVAETFSTKGERATYYWTDEGANSTIRGVVFNDVNRTQSYFESIGDGKWTVYKNGLGAQEWEGTVTVGRDGVRTEIGKSDVDGYMRERRISPDGTMLEQFRGPDGRLVSQISDDVRTAHQMQKQLKIAFEQQGAVVGRENLTVKDVDGGKVYTDKNNRLIETVDVNGVVRRFIYPDEKATSFNQVVELHPSASDPTKLEARSTYIKNENNWNRVFEDGRPSETVQSVRVEGKQIFRTNDEGVGLDGKQYKLEHSVWTTKDSQGRLTQAMYHGDTTDFSYAKDSSGNDVLDRIEHKPLHGDTSTVYQRVSDSEWTIKYPDGRTDNFRGTVKVDNWGQIHQVQTLQPSGVLAYRTTAAHGRTVHSYYDPVHGSLKDKPNLRIADDQGRLSLFSNPEGKIYHVKYNDDGSVREINWPDDLRWKQSADDPKKFVDDNGKALTVENFKVANNGDISMTVDGTSWVMRMDGSRFIDSPKKQVTVDTSGNVTEYRVKAADGKPEEVYRMKYEGDHLVRLDAGSESYVRNPVDEFYYHEPSGRKLGKSLEFHNGQGTITTTGGARDFADANPTTPAAQRMDSKDTERLTIGVSTPGDRNLPPGTGPSAAVVGEKFLDLGARRRIEYRNDGSRSEGFDNAISIDYDAAGRIVETSGDYVRTSFKYTDGVLSEVKFKDRTLTRGEDGNWYRAAEISKDEKAPVMVAKDIQVLANGTLRVTPIDGTRFPADAIPVEKVDYRLDGTVDKLYRNAQTPDARTVVTREATDLERLNSRSLSKLPRNEQGEPRVATTRGELVKKPNGNSIETQVTGAQLAWDKQGRLLASKAPDGLEAQFTYDADGKLDSIQYVRDGKVEGRIVSEPGEPGQAKVWFDESNGVRTRLSTSVDVTTDGTVSFIRADFSGTRIDADGVQVKFDANMRDTIAGTPENIAIQRKHLAHLRDTLLDSPEKRQRFDEMMVDFEYRMRQRPGGAADEQIANTYYSLRKMMEADVAAIPRNQRAVLAQQVLYMLGNPHKIDQGNLPTCNVTAEVITRLFAKNPADAVRLITDPAVSGRFITSEGVIVDMRQINGGLTPQGQARGALGGKFQEDLADIKTDGEYNFAEWIAMATSINVERQSRVLDYSGAPIRRATTLEELRKGVPYRPGDFKYDYQNRLDWGMFSFLGGKELQLTANGAIQRTSGGSGRAVELDPIRGTSFYVNDGARMTSPGLSNSDLVKLSQKIVGKPEEIHFFSRSAWAGDTEKGFKSYDEFQKEVLALQQKGELPATLWVDVRHPPFGHVGDSGAHVITLHRIFQDQHGDWRAEFSNQWGNAYNYMPDNAVDHRSYPLSKLYDAMESLPSKPQKEDKFDKIQKFQMQSSYEKRQAVYRWLSDWTKRVFGRKVEDTK